MPADHPTHDVLLHFLRRELDPEQERTVDLHIGSCPDCERTLAQLAGGVPWPLNPVARLVGDPTLVPDRTVIGTGVSPPSALLVEVPGYEVIAEVGRGGMGVVYKAWQIQLGRVVALKVMPAGADPEQRRRFRNEAEAVARLAHPGIVQIHDVGEHEGQPFLVLEFIDGGSLGQRLDGKPWPAPDAARLVEDLARAIHEAHQHGVVHRDLKPSNVLLQKGDLSPKVTDFGLAKFLAGASQQTQAGDILGTPSYMAPEQATGQNNQIGPATDVYALGATLYELLTGRPPFQGEIILDVLEKVRCDDPIPPRRLRREVPRDLETICLKCLAKEPAKRYASALNLAEDLRRWRQHEPITARRPGWGERLLLWARRRPAAVVTALLLVLLVAVGSVALGLWLDAKWSRDAKPAARRDVEGYWVGNLQAGIKDIRFIVKLTKQEGDSYAGTFQSDDARGVERKIDVIGFQDSSLRFEVKKILAVYEGRLKEDGAELVGEWRQPAGLYALNLRRQEQEPTFARPQEPKRPYPYREEEVAFENPKAGSKLAGTLTLPEDGGPFPAVLLLPGSVPPDLLTHLGPQDRDVTMYGHKPFLVLADYLTRHGVAVLRVDDRGAGGSTGPVQTATLADFAEDALAAVTHLKKHKEIDPARIGLIAHSRKGGFAAPLAAAQSKDVAFLVMLAGGGMTGEEFALLDGDRVLRELGGDEKTRELNRSAYQRQYQIIKEHKDDAAALKQFDEDWEKKIAPLVQALPWPVTKQGVREEFASFLVPGDRSFLTYDPRPTLRKVTCPVLALFGAKDVQAPPKENLPRIEQALKEGGNRDVTVAELPGLNHLLQTCKTGHPSEYAKIEETFAPAALEQISKWILERFGSGSPSR
jgi:pimeloyl-ACP methyl ester carboxylesterase